MGYRIKDWEKFQNFKDRRPPWIKLYRDLLEDDEWFKLEGKTAKVLVALWLIASEDETKCGQLPAIKKLAFRLRLSEKTLTHTLATLSHWVIQDGYNVDTRCNQFVIPETETETETEGEGETEYMSGKKPDDNDLVCRIIEHLNQTTGKHYRPNPGMAAAGLVRARLVEGFTEGDFQHVHRVKFCDWKNTEREIYLRPKTLYSKANFEGYVNQPERVVVVQGQLRRNLIAGEQFLAEERANRERSPVKQIEADPDQVEPDIPEGDNGGYDPPLCDCS